MAVAIVVAGPCYLQTGTGASNALETLGMSQDGARISPQYKRKPVFADSAGGPEGQPLDFQNMLQAMTIRVKLSAFDTAVMQKVVNKAMATATLGQIGSPGALVGAGGFSHALYLPSSGDSPWYFPNVILQDPHEVNFGTVYSQPELTFFAWALVGGADLTAATKVLYTRTAPS